MEGNREKVRGWAETLSYCRSDGGAGLVQVEKVCSKWSFCLRYRLPFSCTVCLYLKNIISRNREHSLFPNHCNVVHNK